MTERVKSSTIWNVHHISAWERSSSCYCQKKSLGRPLPVVFLMTRVVTNYIYQSYPKPTKVDAFGQEIGSIVSALVITREGLYARRMGVMTLQFSF